MSATGGGAGHSTRTVIVIDDNAIDLILYRRVIERSGLFGRVLTFDYAENALAHLRRHPEEPIDAILLDINMPRMDGFEFLERASDELERLPAACVVIMLTTSLEPEDLARSRTFPSVKGYVDKPLMPERLRDIVELVGRQVPA